MRGQPISRESWQLRLRRIKTMAVILLLSQGVPMLVAGDEFGRTQQGNNNAWCQDNEISWLDWSLLQSNKGFFRFFKECIALRKKHKIFRRKIFSCPSIRPLRPEKDRKYPGNTLTRRSKTGHPDCHGLAFLLRALGSVRRME